jgi:hypothetical protein
MESTDFSGCRSYTYFLNGWLLRFATTGPGVLSMFLWLCIGIPIGIRMLRLACHFLPCGMAQAGGATVGLAQKAILIAGLAAGVWVATVMTWAVIRVYFSMIHRFPSCSSGRCRRNSYGWRVQEPFGWEQKHVFRYYCRCGGNYLRLGTRFYILTNGSIQPYMRFDPRGQWIADHGIVDPDLLSTQRDVWALPKVPQS